MFVCTHRADRLLASIYLADDSGGLLVVKVWDGLKVSRWCVRERGERRREEREGERREKERGERREKERGEKERRREEREGERRREEGVRTTIILPTPPQAHALEDLVVPGMLVAVSNLSYLGLGYAHHLPSANAGDTSVFSQHPREQHLKSALQELSKNMPVSWHCTSVLELLLLFSRKFSIVTFNFRIRGRNIYRHSKKESIFEYHNPIYMSHHYSCKYKNHCLPVY